MAELEKLDTLAARINEEHCACETAANAVPTHAMSAGELLMEAKGQLPHGAFGSWLKENFAGSDRTARAYMRVYSHREELEAKRQSSATLSLDGPQSPQRIEGSTTTGGTPDHARGNGGAGGRCAIRGAGRCVGYRGELGRNLPGAWVCASRVCQQESGSVASICGALTTSLQQAPPSASARSLHPPGRG